MLQLEVQYISHRQAVLTPARRHTHTSKLLLGTRKWLRSVHPTATSTPFPSTSPPRGVLSTLSHSATIALAGTSAASCPWISVRSSSRDPRSKKVPRRSVVSQSRVSVASAGCVPVGVVNGLTACSTVPITSVVRRCSSVLLLACGNGPFACPTSKAKCRRRLGAHDWQQLLSAAFRRSVVHHAESSTT